MFIKSMYNEKFSFPFFNSYTEYGLFSKYSIAFQKDFS